MRASYRSLAALLLFALFAFACSGDDEPDVTATPVPATPTATQVPEPTATSVPPPPGPSTPIGERPLTIWLIEAASGSVTTLYEERGQGAWPLFGGDGMRALVLEFLQDGTEIGTFDLEGNEVSRARVAPPPPCEWQQVEVDGALHVDLHCTGPVPDIEIRDFLVGPGLSPDGSWFDYQVQHTTPTPVPFGPPGYDQWALNLQTGERRLLQADMEHCGGCDFAGSGGGWSPSGRYLVFGENGPQYRIFLTDFEAGTTVQLSSTPQNTWPVLQWSPNADLLLRPEGGDVVVEDVATGAILTMEGVSWPASFDASGALVFSPWPAFGGQSDQFSTVIADAATGLTLEHLDGAARYFQGRNIQPVVRTDAGEIVAALEFASGCEGTTIYAGNRPLTCIDYASGATVSPDGSTVAIARITRPDPSVPQTFPFDGNWEYEVVLFDVASQTERVVATGAAGQQPPLLIWHQDSTHLLVRWPTYTGL